jgi:hypothetical protein
MPNNGVDKNGKRILGNQGTLTSIGLDQKAKKRKPKRPSPSEQRQLIEQGKEGMQREVQAGAAATAPPAPILLPQKKKKKRLADTAKSTYGV